jgi:hypothetical protein
MGVERMVLRTSERFVKGLRKNPGKGAITGTHGSTSLMPGTLELVDHSGLGFGGRQRQVRGRRTLLGWPAALGAPQHRARFLTGT